MSRRSIWLEERFRRLTSGGTFVPEVDGLRFVAIASVVIFHLYGQLVRYYGVHVSTVLATLLHNGDRGVRLFFVISGFILASPFASHWLRGSSPVCLRRYFLRRLTRLEPPYILNLFICAALLVVVNHVSVFGVIPHLLASLFYSHNLVYGSVSTINIVTWSLEVEVQFYLLMPLLALVFSIQNHWARRGLIVTVMLIAVALQAHWAHPQRAQLTIAYYIQFFLAGFLLADLYLLRKSEDKRWQWDVVSLLGWPMVFALSDRFSQFALPLIVVALYWAAFHGRLANRVFCFPVLTLIGGMCYTTYLFHFLVIAFATRVMGHARPTWLVAAVSIALIMMVSSGYFLLVERPCMDRNWPSKLATFVRGRKKHIPTAAMQWEKSSS